MGVSRSLVLVLGLLLASSAYAALPPSYGPYTVGGKSYYVVNGSNPSLNTGYAVCRAAGLSCLGYTDFSTSVCSAVHPNATVVQSYNGSSTGYYCNGAPQTGECSFRYNTCDICPACNVNANCNFTVSGLFRQMYVQCGGTLAANVIVSPSVTIRKSRFTNFAAFWAKAFAKSGANKRLVFGFTSPSRSPGGYLCPMACYLFSVGTFGGGPSAVNCNVNQSEIYKPVSKCTGYQTNYGQGNNTACSCHPDPTQPEACPSSCTSQATCEVDISVIGKTNIPCDGIAQGTNNQNCKCAYVNGNWTLGSRFGIN